ncbi:MAG: tetratricopeptide repeat protein, partial [candidate division WOR-3 bacterium]
FVYQQSGGNPFYIEEILRELDQKKKIYWNGKEWVFVKELAVAIPSSIAETIKRKLKFLDPEIRQFLEIAAVYGQEFMPEIIAMASRRNVGQILDALDELRRLGFIKERTSDVFFFSEDVVRQIVYKSMSKSDLLQYHKLVGEAIENFYQGSLTNYIEQLANHFTIANDSQKALLYSKQAALKAKENYAHTLAIKFFDNALKYEDNIDDIFNIKYSLAEIYLLTGDYKKAIQQLNVCLKINPNAHRVYETLGSVYENMGEYNNSLKRYRQGLKITQGTDAVHTFKTAMAWVYTQLGQYLRAQKECEHILKKKKHVRKRDLSDAYIILGIIHLQLGKYTRAESCLKNGLRIRKSAGDKKRVAACYLDLALNYQELFKMKASETFYKKALTLYEAIGYQHGIVVSLLDLGTLYANFNLQKAEECYLKALSIAKLIGAKRDMVYLYDNLGNINYNRLMSDQTLFNYKQALTFAKKTNFDEGIIFSSIHLSEFYREKGQLKKGKSYLKSAQRVAGKINLRYYNFECLIEELHYALLTKNLKKANILSEKLISQLRAEHNVYYKIYGFIHRARTLGALKRYTKAHTYLKRALHFVKSLPRNWIAGEIYYVRGITYLKARKVREAENMFSQAGDIFKTIGNLRYLDKIEAKRDLLQT